MVRPVDDADAAVVVHIRRDETTGSLPDITVESSPVVFEFRNQVLLQAVDYIDRCIIAAFGPLRSGTKPPAQPLWRVLVPSSRMLMPRASDGVVECVVGPASFGNEVVWQPTRTQKIEVKAADVRAYITRGGVAPAPPPLPPPPRTVTTLTPTPTTGLGTTPTASPTRAGARRRRRRRARRTTARRGCRSSSGSATSRSPCTRRCGRSTARRRGSPS